MNKTRQIEQYMLNNSITSWEAIEKFGETRLSAVIFNLKKKYNIADMWEEGKDRNGNPCRWKRYKIISIRNLEQEARSLLNKMKFWRK